MNMDKNYFLARLANGEDMDTIGQEMAAMMNEAMAEHTAKIEAEKLAAADKENAKRELIVELIDIVKELAILEGFDDGDDFEMTEEDMDQVMNAFNEMFDAMREMKKLANALNEIAESKPHSARKISHIAPKSDDEVLADFIKMFS